MFPYHHPDAWGTSQHKHEQERRAWLENPSSVAYGPPPPVRMGWSPPGPPYYQQAPDPRGWSESMLPGYQTAEPPYPPYDYYPPDYQRVHGDFVEPPPVLGGGQERKPPKHDYAHVAFRARGDGRSVEDRDDVEFTGAYTPRRLEQLKTLHYRTPHRSVPADAPPSTVLPSAPPPPPVIPANKEELKSLYSYCRPPESNVPANTDAESSSTPPPRVIPIDATPPSSKQKESAMHDSPPGDRVKQDPCDKRNSGDDKEENDQAVATTTETEERIPDRGAWSIKSEAARQREKLAKRRVDTFLQSCLLMPESSFPITREVVPAEIHLTAACWVSFREYVESKGCRAKRREATEEERGGSKRKAKMYVISIVVPVHPVKALPLAELMKQEKESKEERKAKRDQQRQLKMERKKEVEERKAAEVQAKWDKMHAEYGSIVEQLRRQNRNFPEQSEESVAPAAKRIKLVSSRKAMVEHTISVYHRRMQTISQQIAEEKRQLESALVAKYAVLEKEAMQECKRVKESILTSEKVWAPALGS